MKKKLCFTLAFLAGLVNVASAGEYESPQKLPADLYRNKNMKSSFADFDGDGKKDMVVAGIRGVFYFAKNTGDNKTPKFAPLKEIFKLKHW